MKLSDYVAQKAVEHGVKHVFMVTGGGAMHLNHSFGTNEDLGCIFNHHEQACTMAVQTYWKITGVPTFALVTAGAGSSNAITGVLSAWADSIPCIVISGQENARYITPDHDLRMYGIQGYDSTFAVSKMTKYTARIMEPEQVLYELEKAWHFATTGRPGPCWLDFPMSVQSAMVDEETLPHYIPDTVPTLGSAKIEGDALAKAVQKTLELICSGKRPLLWLGASPSIFAEPKVGTVSGM